MTGTAIIRQRGQITIPRKIMKRLSWTQPEQMVKLGITSDEKLLIEPYIPHAQVNWKQLRRQLDRVSRYRGKRGNLSQFIIEDRERH